MIDYTYSSSGSADTTGGGLPYNKIFETQRGLVLILSPTFTILAATDSYLRETFTVRDQIVGKNAFEVFPDNPNEDASFSINLKNSFGQVLSTGKYHAMSGIRYDLPDPKNPGSFLERYWSATNTPILNEQGDVIYIIHEPINITEAQKAKNQLEESREREQFALAKAEHQRFRLERLFNQAPAALAMLEGPELVYKVINKSYQDLFPGRELLGKPLFEALPELKDQPIDDIIQTVYRTGETFEGKEILVPVARYAGQPVEDIYWNFIYQALLDAQGQVNGILIFALDVTEFVQTRQKAEKTAEALQALNRELEKRVEDRTAELQLARAEAVRQRTRLENLFMDAPASICILNGPDLVYELVNPDYAKLFPGRSLLGKPILEALPEIANNPVYKTFKEVFATGITHAEPEMYIPIARLEDGVMEDRYFRYIQQPRYDENGGINGVVVFALEVTEQVESRKAVEASARQLRLVTDSLPVLIGYLDREEVYRFANKAYEKWFPLKSEEMLGRKVLDVIGEKPYKNIKEYIDRALAGELLEFEATMPYREGFTKHIHATYVPDVREGEVIGFFTLISDVTEQVETRIRVEKSEQEAKAMAEELRLANLDLGAVNQQLTRTNVDLDNFIYTASHDLRAPISNIEMLMRELLIELPQESLQEEGVSYILTMMQKAIERFKKTIAHLTEISKLQKENSTNVRWLKLEDMVEEVRLDLEQLILTTGARIETDLHGCPQVSFTEKNLRSIVYNLLSNAIKYRHPEREPLVRISCHEETDYLVLTVQDNGLGLTKTQQEKLYTMFRRFHDHVEGSGIGLYMVKRILENADGKIEVESTLGEGTTFRVYFKK